MQYPVFPFILSDYISDRLDLTNQNVFRKLNKPIACQKPRNEEKYKMHYQVVMITPLLSSYVSFSDDSSLSLPGCCFRIKGDLNSFYIIIS